MTQKNEMTTLRFIEATNIFINQFFETKISRNTLLEIITDFENANSSLNSLKELADYKISTMNRIILYYMCFTLIDWRTGCSLYRCIKPFFANTDEENNEIQAFITGDNELVDKLLVKITRSKIIDDFYVELAPDSLVMFLVDINQLSSVQKNKVEIFDEQYFHLN